MKRFAIFLILAVFLIAGCGVKPASPTAIKVNDIEISADEFEESFKDSSYTTKQNFLESFISRLLILKEAERKYHYLRSQFLQYI